MSITVTFESGSAISIDDIRAIAPNSKLVQQYKVLVALLRAARCPETRCQGGTVLVGAQQHEDGEWDYDIHQCQWCDERDKALEQESGYEQTS